ncbi:MAG: cell surface protein SprA [Ignavibacteria bacterium]|nr:cell surface protein SprA [Ignavibacteria bacterium]
MHKTTVKFIYISFLIALFFYSEESFSQGRDRSKFILGYIDTSSYIDTSIVKDTSRTREPVDSTARYNNFKYERTDGFTPSIDEIRSPLLLYGSNRIEYKLSFDSLGNVVITQSFENEEIKVPLIIPLEKYIETRSIVELHQQMYRIVADYYKIETEDDLEKLFKTITEITIPLPFASETIFGPPTISLKINGLIDITASYQQSKNEQGTIFQETQNQNNINFKQNVQVTTKGTVGDKLTIDADWNSERTFDFENQLKLKYKGYPDEVIQSIEAGNVSLETKSNLIGSTQALFGVKAQFKLGPLSLTTIASQKKSEKKEVNITGGSVETPFEIPIWNYSETNYLLDESYEQYFLNFYRKGLSQIEITEVEVWVYSEANNPNKRSAICYDSLGARPVGGYSGLDTINSDGRILNANLKKLESNEYTLHKIAGYITLNSEVRQPNDVIAVAYRVKIGAVEEQFGDFVRDVSSNARLRLKMLRHTSQQPPDQNPNHSKLWRRMLKNIYHLGVRNIKDDPSTLNFNIYYQAPGENPTTNYNGPGSVSGRNWMNLVGLDYRRNGSTDSIPEGDNLFDFFAGNTIDLKNGNIIIPYIKPFSETLLNAGVDQSYVGKNDTIYVSSKSTARDFGNIKFFLKGSAKGDASSRYSLGFNVVEGSVKVFNGAVQLTPGIDYTIDYTTGELVIINNSALVPGANLKITYETNDLFQLASKTLLGTRAELQITKNSYLGFTLINLKQQTLNDKVRIGEEPTNNTILGFDAAADIKTGFLTNLINKIPGYNTKEESYLNLKGEVAFMIPEPNTKKSRIPSDNGESVAYIDDFEGVKKLIPFGLNPLSWTLGSIPVDSVLVPGSSYSTETVRDSLMNKKRSKLNWYSLLNSVPIKDVYPNKSIASNQNQSLTPFVLNIQPSTVGMYNYITQSEFEAGGPPQRNWCGIFKYLNTSQTNLIDENINYIEIWMQVNEGNPLRDSAKMIIDLGTISEKVITSSIFTPKRIGDRVVDYHTEDLNGNGQLDVGEDVGLDGYENQDEKNRLLNAGLVDLGNLPDPGRDNYFWTQGSNDFSSFNGSELNATNLTEAKRIDTEDLNNDGTLNTINNYLEYVIPLDSASFSNHPFISGGGNLGWYQFIIPLDQFSKIIGPPNTNYTSILTNVQYARIWFKGFENKTVIKIGDMNLVGNQWVKSNKNDTTYSVSVVSIEDNSSFYQPPVPGDVLRQRDQTQVDQNVLSNEQSLSLNVQRLLPGQGKYVFKSFNTRPLDLINYKILKLFVNGDSSFTYTSPDKYDAAMVIRIGSDTANYYEYRAPIHPDVRPGTPWNSQNEVTINLAELTAIKQIRDTSNIHNLVYIDVPNGPPGSKYGIIGFPSIRDVRQITVGIYNNNNDPIVPKELTGSVWFNEMRVIKTNDKSGYAFNFSANLKLADLGTLNFAYNKTDPNFHSVENRFGSLNLANSWEISGQFNFHKIINSLLSKYVSVKFKDFFYIPISFSHVETLDKPKYIPSTDVDIENAVRREYERILAENPGNVQLAEQRANNIRITSQTLKIRNSFAITGMKFNFPGDNFFVNEILNKMEINFVRNSYIERSPTLESKYAWDMNGNIGLNSTLSLMNLVNLKIGKWLPLGEEFKEAKIYFFFPFMPVMPFFTSSLTMRGNFNRNRDDQKLRNLSEPNPTSRLFNAERSFSLNWKFIENWIIDIGGDYSFRSGSDLTFLETTNDSLRRQRSEREIFRDIFFNNGLINWGKDLNYSQSVTINPRFNIPGLRNFLDVTSSYRVNYGWQASTYSNALGSNVGYTNDLQASAFIKLNKIFDIFKSSESKGGAYQDDQSPLDIIKLIRSFIPDQLNVTFSQSNQITNPAISQRPGFGNFWIKPGGNDEKLGPSRLYQLGWSREPGKRIPGVQLTDGINVNNSITFNGFITPIFPNNLKINLTYKTTTGNTKTLSYITDRFGNTGNPIGTSENQIITRPSFFITSDIIPKLAKPFDRTTQAKEISESFENNIVSFPFPSWTLSLNGVEKFEMFSGFAQSMTIESGYSSEYRKTISYDGIRERYISNQAITSGFSPIIGVNITFKPISEGNLTASFKLSKTDNYNLEPNNAKVTNNATNDISINANFTKSGFKIPLFGLQLDNNLTISFSYTKTKNDPVVYSYNTEAGIWESNTMSGSTSTTLNPSIQYNLSRSVSLQLFYKYTKVEPTGTNLSIPTRTSNEAGLNIRLQIQ